jgi:hypothetical protein
MCVQRGAKWLTRKTLFLQFRFLYLGTPYTLGKVYTHIPRTEIRASGISSQFETAIQKSTMLQYLYKLISILWKWRKFWLKILWHDALKPEQRSQNTYSLLDNGCTTLTRPTEHGRSSHTASERIYRKYRPHHLFYFCVTSPRTRNLRVLHSNCCCLQSPFLATGLYATILILLQIWMALRQHLTG